ncbi:SH2 domain-containing protein 7 isoform X1 [Tiliqua scincoides]|uniref:SH2 domain-containing protein 7 isoform X1 n=1 Tax=Tiliqua scincoides TaxID=71010 RepID=UPI0034618F5D
MENKQPAFLLGKESNVETENQPSEMLKHLVLRWFLETQAPLILQDGRLPEWFHGFITRKQTEDLLKDKDFGCFLIRLNERALGYILSYRGKDRCRHFVISCQRNGHYVIAGDTHTHESLAGLIGYYRTSEIEPFEENLTTACSKAEDKGIYDEISLDRQATSKQSSASATPLLTSQTSSSSPTSKLEKDSTSNPPAPSRRKVPEPQKSLSKDRQSLNTEDLDAAPPIPDRSRLLMTKSFEEDSGDGRNKVYAAQKKDNKSLDMPKEVDKAFTDNSQKRDEANQGSRKKTSSVFALSKQSDRFYSNKISPKETCSPGTIYSEISLEKSSLTQPEPQGSQFSFKPPKKATLSSPPITPPKLSPRLPNKPKTNTERQQSESSYPTSSASPAVDEEHRKPVHDQSAANSPKETLYGQVNKMKPQKPAASASDNTSNTYESIPFEQDSERLPMSLSMKPTKTYDQICSKSGQPSRAQIYTEDPYEKIPDFSRDSSTKHVSTSENTYEQISFGSGKGAPAKPSHKSGKPRRFLFTDKKTKL